MTAYGTVDPTGQEWTPIASPVPAACIFCNHHKLTGEHVFPKWLQAVFPASKVGPPTAAFFCGLPDGTPYRDFLTGKVATITSNIVCAACNTGWMARLETDAQPLITAMAAGSPTNLNMVQQLLLATWTVKTAMTCEMTLQRDHRFSDADRATVRTEARPPASVIVQMAAYTGREGPLEYAKVVAGVRAGRQRVDIGELILHTLKIGCLILRITAFPPGERRAFQRIATPRDVQIPLFPPVAACHWPPAIVLDDDGLGRFRVPPNAPR